MNAISDESDTFSSEFRHETVKKFVTQLLEGSIEPMHLSSATDEKLKIEILRYLAELLNDIQKYVSGTLRGDELATVEQSIFAHVGRGRLTGALREKIPSPSQIEKEVQKLHTRIDAINTLLQQVLIVLQEVVKKLDK